MLEPFLELLADAADTTATIIVLLALWEGRTARGRNALVRRLGVRAAKRRIGVDDFLREAWRTGRHAPSRADAGLPSGREADELDRRGVSPP